MAKNSATCPSARFWRAQFLWKKKTLASMSITPTASATLILTPRRSSTRCAAKKPSTTTVSRRCYQSRFGEHIPLIRREDVKGLIQRRPVWLSRPLRISDVRKQVEVMDYETDYPHHRKERGRRPTPPTLPLTYNSPPKGQEEQKKGRETTSHLGHLPVRCVTAGL